MIQRMEEGKYAVLLRRPEDFNPVRIAEVLARARKAPVQDMLNAAKASWGIIAEDKTRSEASALAEILDKGGLSAVVTPQVLLEEMPKARLLSSLDWDKISLRLSGGAEREYRGPGSGSSPAAPGAVIGAGYAHSAAGGESDLSRGAGSPEIIPWEKIILIGAAGFKQTTAASTSVEPGPGMKEKLIGLGLTLATGIPIRLSGDQGAPQRVESSDLVCFLELVLKEPDARLRIDAQNFDYSRLKSRMGYNTLANFKLLVAEIARKSAGALESRGTRVILQSRPMWEMGYESLNDLERESRWLLTLRALQLA